MGYPEGFSQAVEAFFPGDERVREALSAGGEIVGLLLDDAWSERISPDEVIAALDSGATEGLRARAERMLEARRLYEEWLRLTGREQQLVVGL